MNATQIRKEAETTGTDPKNWGPEGYHSLHYNTQRAVRNLYLEPAPWGTPQYDTPLMFTRKRAIEMQPDCAGKRLAAHFNEVNGGRFVLGMGIYQAYWQWRPDTYKDANGVPNQLVVAGDGFPMARIRFGTDGLWRWDWMRNPDVLKASCNSEMWGTLTQPYKEWTPFDQYMAGVVTKNLGLEAGTDLTFMMGVPVSEDEFIRLTYAGRKLC
ncbi:MAG: hypothetical protein UY48_C0006G0042 [Candidatus Gottesmanbacteria bacterium GW2011_GWB1_49_7]|uniref:Uncharacterized protein n=1 Tax=Candidatus Gottesmanbacteria bacterium GW2011_GWB1_49_7 TaxID=1618448 RepID=A0A0G1Z2J5_9BACT|nr:MAG: hypothetical protein UY48_C0006G0042 [Candidatus Gottesmanbacteria bacterium GW2011_GWB1_49_7]